MADDLRDRVLAAVRKGLAGPLDIPKPKKAVRGCELVDSARERGVRETREPHTTLTNKIKSLTPSHGLSAKNDSQPENVCVQCGGVGGDLWTFDTPPPGRS